MATRHGAGRREFRFLGLRLQEQRFKRGMTALVTSLIVFSLLLARLRPEAISYQIGDTATHTIKAPRAAMYVDKAETERLREEAAKSVVDQYTRDASADDRSLQALSDIFDLADQVRRDSQLTDNAARIARLQELLDIELSPSALQQLIENPRSALQRAEQLSLGLLRDMNSRPLQNDPASLKEARQQVTKATAAMPITPRYRALVAELVQATLQPNLIFDAAATEAKRDERRKQVDDVLKQIQPGDVVIYEGENVTQRHLDMFTALGMIQPSVDYVQALALLGVLCLLTLTLTLYVRVFAADVHADDRSYLLLCATLIGAAALFSLTKSAARFDVFAISIATAASIFLALCLRPVVAVGVALYLGALASLASPGNDVRLLLAATICATLAAYSVKPRESRGSTVTRAAVLTAFINGLTVAACSFVFGYIIHWNVVGYSAVGGLVSAIGAAGLITVIERPLGLTTSLLLLELQNPNEPILKRLLTEAPGSYQSSVMVANLAEPAAEAVDADPVLTRTACMYHDIGKLKRPYFFIENQFGADNPHGRLSPHLSALVIIAHVKDGIELAREIHLPPVLASVIAQHHGTSLASFMYQRARAEAEEGEEVLESDFRYPGPKPQTRENAIIMLADTVEAAARAMTEHNPEQITELVERLVNARIADGQLDESPLTFDDITVIKASFVKTLNGMFHQRLGYPTEPGQASEPLPPAGPTSEQKARALVGDGH